MNDFTKSFASPLLSLVTGEEDDSHSDQGLAQYQLRDRLLPGQRTSGKPATSFDAGDWLSL